jgi:hypothetical protein
VTVFQRNPMWRFLLNSPSSAFGATVIALVLGLPAAYSIARYRQQRLAVAILVARIMPGISYLVPWFIMFSRLKLIGSYSTLILAHLMITLPMTIWLMIGFFEDIPSELDEAALIDGCNPFQAFFKIALPADPAGHCRERDPQLHLLVEQLPVLAGAGQPGDAAAAGRRVLVHLLHASRLGRLERRSHHRHAAGAHHDSVRAEAHGARADPGVGEGVTWKGGRQQTGSSLATCQVGETIRLTRIISVNLLKRSENP